MSRITIELLRKRSEHNEGVLSTLEEITLHQQDIGRIELLDKYCKHLKILYLQNNLIPKMENLKRLKELEYLNIGLNNISKIEGLEGCESLRKLDLILNFIDIEDIKESIDNLSNCKDLRELYTTGNPCEDWSGYKDYVTARIPSLMRLNGTDIVKSDRIKALQDLEILSIDLQDAGVKNIQKKKGSVIKPCIDFTENPPSENSYSKESRIKTYEEMKEKEEKDKLEEKIRQREMHPYLEEEEEKKETLVYNKGGELHQCNEGGYKFKMDDDIFKKDITFELRLPKYMDTSLVDIDLNPLYIRVTAKGKVTQLKFWEEIIVEKSKVQRSTTTGVLTITCPKLNFDSDKRDKILLRKEKDSKKKKLKAAEDDKAKLNKDGKAVDIKHMLKKGEDENEFLREIKSTTTKDEEKEKKEKEIVEDLDLDFNIDDVPPLE